MRPQARSEAACLQRKGARCSGPGSGSKSVGNSPRGQRVVKEKLDSKRREIFLHEQRSNKEISKDIIRADCMNHGYRVEKSIGEGAYAKVKSAEVLPAKLARNQTLAELAEETETYLQVAIKVIENKQVPKEFLKKFLPRELSNHCPLDPHKNVVRVFEQFRTTERVYVVMEYCCKGDLLDLINQRISDSQRGLGEDRVRDMFKQMVDGVQHIHNNGIVHRDLKCENILICENYAVKLTDFGFSTRFDDKESLLRTSCGSYAYTAPEVIKSKPYNGFKSDTWSLGVILFAMLNGRLPFNDSQLMEMEEDMKMQRLRFERNVSFDAMVLVRRILQYNPAQRPSLQEILNDPWMTGKKMIPRQINRPKWINPYEAKSEETDIADEAVVGSNPVYYKSTVPERGHDATVTIKHEGNETVMLKSRVGPKKNIWTSGPAVVYQNRPNTWPRAEKESDQTTKRNQDRQSRGPRAYVRHASANTTVIVKSQPKNRKGCTQTNNTTARVSNKTVHMSKWFMDKFMKKSRGEGIHTTNERKLSECNFCESEASLESMASQNQNTQKTASQNQNTQKTTSQNQTTQKIASQNQTTQKMASQNQTTQKTTSQNQTTQKIASQNQTTQKMASQNQTTQKTTFQNQTTQKMASQNQTTQKTASQNQTTQKTAIQRQKQTNPSKTVHNEVKDQNHEDDPDRLMIDFGLFEGEMNLQESVDLNEFDSESTPDIDVSIVKQGPSRGQGPIGPTSSKGPKKGQGQIQTKGKENVCSRSCSGDVKRKTLTMSANVKGTGYRKSSIGSSSLTASKSLDLSNKNLYKYMVNRSTNPAERVKYFRERITMIYGSSVNSADSRSGLPPLIGQAIRPPTGNNGSKSSSRVPGRAWSSGSRVKTDHVRTKPVQRVVVHSAT